MINIHIILVAIDFSDLSPTVLDYACSLAMAWKARLLVVHVVHDLERKGYEGLQAELGVESEGQ